VPRAGKPRSAPRTSPWHPTASPPVSSLHWPVVAAGYVPRPTGEPGHAKPALTKKATAVIAIAAHTAVRIIRRQSSGIRVRHSASS